jgi:hypothetical protein
MLSDIKLDKDRKLFAIQEIISVLNRTKTLDQAFDQICQIIVNAYGEFDLTGVFIKVGEKTYKSKNCCKSQWRGWRKFEIPGMCFCVLDIFFSEELTRNEFNIILKRDKIFLDNITTILNGALSKKYLEKLQYDNTERLKELQGINRVTDALNRGRSLGESLQEICSFLPQAWQYPEYTVARITYDGQVFLSQNFKETSWVQNQHFETPDGKEGSVEIFYLKRFPKSYEGPFMREERNLIDNMAALISGSVSKKSLQNLLYENTERLKELKAINRATDALDRGKTLDESLQEICCFLPDAWQYPEHTACKIVYGNKVFRSRDFIETPWMQRQQFETPDGQKGEIEIYYLKEFPPFFEGPFLKEERNLIDNLAALISGTASKKAFHQLFLQNTERLKELKGINQTSQILKQGKSIEESLQTICTILPDAWQYPEYTAVRIRYGDKTFASGNFTETKWVQRQNFEAPEDINGIIEVFYLKEFPTLFEGPFLQEERNLLINLANLIAGSATRDAFNKLFYENKERLKELKAINQTSQLIAQGKSIDETLQEICSLLPRSWQYPKYTTVRISYESKIYESREFKETSWVQKENFITIDNKRGTIEIYYLKEFPKIYEGPFLKEERHLLINIAKLISGYLNDYKGREMVRKTIISEKGKNTPSDFRESLVRNKQPLQLFFNKQVLDKYIYLDMMKYKVKEILFVATLYDAFTLQTEDNFFERFMGEIYQYSLFSLPRITGVTSSSEAIEILDTKQFDLVILMVGIDRHSPVSLSKKIKQKQPNLQVFLLLNQKAHIQYFEDLVPTTKSIDKVFIWNGDAQIFFAIVKSIEDKVNVENDTKIGLVRIILLVEDSAQYYSKYLQILYSIVFGQVQQLLPEVEKNELDKIAKMRSRPKILLARNYEDAHYIFNKYKDFMLCVISDVEFEREGKIDKKAGIRFIRYVQSHILNLPIILQSSDDKNRKLASDLKVSFINKNSDTLLSDLKRFLSQYLGFGDFIFREKDGKPIARAHSLREFETLLKDVPDETFYLHAIENQYSLWLMSRGEIQLAKILNPLRIGDFKDIKESKKFFIDTLVKFKEERKKGKVLNFEETSILSEKNIIAYASGSYGGKGRGLAFINALINNLDFSEFTDRINIRTPKTVIIGTHEFENFIEKNNLYTKVIGSKYGYLEVKQFFINGNLSATLIDRLKDFINQVDKPIAVRSSSLLEDSVSQPFAGVFDTYIIPFNGNEKKQMLRQLSNAIKLVFASVYSDNARAYFHAIHHKIEEEKMAVVLQELVGTQYGDYYYPHISGVAQSYNFYPVAHMSAEEGFAVIALGLGSYVVGGRNSFRFSPKYPKIEMYSPKDLLNSSQVRFYALDFTKRNIDYIKEGELGSLSLIDISEAEKHGTLKHCSSVYNLANDRIEVGLSIPGPRILNFANILKYDYIPLAETIDLMLNTIKEALGSPVEIEYAVDLTPTVNNLPSFYLLQVKPLTGSQQSYNVDLSVLDKSKMVLYTESSLGNGEITDIQDVIFINAENFDKLRTLDMVGEVELLNNSLKRHNRQYILIGPGRWGTRDQFLGIPVNWAQISNAKVIIEISLANYPLDSSLGSHFFHNVTSMNIGYFSVHDSSWTDFIRWENLKRQKVVNRTKYFIHVRFSKPLSILMNGKMKTAAIIDNTEV